MSVDLRGAEDLPLFSCLCVTEERPAFMPWLLWNYDKQDYENRELVVVDSSPGDSDLPHRPDVRIVRCPPGTSVAAKRNIALQHARGDLITWFDDDDWQHPRKLSTLAAALRHARLAGVPRAWFVELQTGNARFHTLRQGLLFNSLGVHRELAVEASFDEGRRRASDTPWVVSVSRRAGSRAVKLQEPLFFWLCHDRNLSNRAGRRSFREPLEAVRSSVGEEAWGETEAELAKLRVREASPARPRRPEAATPARRGGRTRLCVVVTTYNRPDQLERLLDNLEREWPGDGLDVRVYDDASPSGYVGVAERLRRRGWTYVRSSVNHGKKRWWRWWNAILADLRRTEADLYLVIQDDMLLCERFFDRSLELWSRIPDERKASLFLHLDEHAVERGRAGWTPARDEPVGDVVRCGWVDLTAFLCERRFFEAVDWRLDPIPERRWAADPLLGSGVGAQLSGRLHRQGLTLYRVAESLTVHDQRSSLMNADARRRWPMRTVRFVDGEGAAARLANGGSFVYAAVASVPARESGLAKVVESLLPQVDQLGVYLNGYPRIPSFLDHPKILVATSQESGDRGDAGKFFWADEARGYVLVCDDDLRYPSDYVARLVAGIERYGKRAAVGFHGAVLHDHIADYYRSRRLLHFAQARAADTPVHVLGTGAAGYHTSTITVRATDFSTPNMADVFFALLGQRQRVPFVCLAHERGWLTELPRLPSDSIYTRALRGGAAGRSEQTLLARSHRNWTLHEATPDPHARAATNRPRPRRAVRTARARSGLGPLLPVAISGPSRDATLQLPKGDHITLALQRSSTYYERDLLDAIRLLGPRGTFVDVGAHYGNHTLFFALECRAERVVAIEPNDTSFQGLLANVRANGIAERVTALPIAIHPSCHRVDLAPIPWRARPGRGARTNSGMVGVTRARGSGGVSAAPLDQALAPFRSIAVLKVDAEDLGVEIIESGTSVLERDRPIVAVEVVSETQRARLDRLLSPLGYALVGQFCWTPTWLWASQDRRPLS